MPFTLSTVGLVTAVAVAVAVAATVLPAVRASRTSTVLALANSARPPERTAWLIALSARLPVPLLLGLRIAARREGLVRSGRVITAAAAIMMVVFASFAGGDLRVLKLFGVALATAVFLDAFVIRMVLLPAVLQLLGRRTWWFPGWLDRGLPRLAIEPKPGAQQIPALDEAA